MCNFHVIFGREKSSFIAHEKILNGLYLWLFFVQNYSINIHAFLHSHSPFFLFIFTLFNIHIHIKYFSLLTILNFLILFQTNSSRIMKNVIFFKVFYLFLKCWSSPSFRYHLPANLFHAHVLLRSRPTGRKEVTELEEFSGKKFLGYPRLTCKAHKE